MNIKYTIQSCAVLLEIYLVESLLIESIAGRNFNFNENDDSFVQRLTSLIPMGRMALPNEFKGAITFLSSDASSFVTGHNLVIDGGRTIW